MIVVTRRTLCLGAAALAAWPACAQSQALWPADAAERLAALEKRSGARLGVAVLDTGNGATLQHRGDERFALCSTFKLLAAALVLTRVDQGQERLDRRVHYTKSDIVTSSPEIERHLGDGMTVAQLCEAAITRSDNTAANLILASFGGPAAWTQFVRSLGDEVSRLDRIETALNDVAPGDPRDTTTPAAMVADMRRVLLGDTLKPASRAQLIAWLMANKTGDKRLRAGLPASWRIGDKTGSGFRGEANDIAILWPQRNGHDSVLERGPVLAAVYLNAPSSSGEARNAVIADVGRLIAGG
jgi:beta-lactamase class A